VLCKLRLAAAPVAVKFRQIMAATTLLAKALLASPANEDELLGMLLTDAAASVICAVARQVPPAAFNLSSTHSDLGQRCKAFRGT
jgi:hypothetical protein